jgi:uncharacterized protein YdeI (YjbR/CyaY-like superfamily)
MLTATSMPKPRDLPILLFASQNAWESWLDEHHESSSGVWLQIAKTGSGVASVSYPEAIEAALCFGWIDGQKGALDELFWLQRFTSRKPRSKWSAINCAKVAALIVQGRMRPSGIEEVELAKQDGRWDAAYPGRRSAAVPPDLELALGGNAQARAFFAALDSGNRYAILYRIHEAKKPETRARRIEKFVAMLAAGEKIHP